MTVLKRGRVAVLVAAALVLAACSSGGTAPEGPPTGVPAPPAEGLLWSGDAETGDLSQFQDTPWNVVAGTPPTVVEDPVRQGTYAVQVGIDGTSTSADGICCGSRSELVPKFRDLVPGDDLYFAFSTYLAPGFPTDAYWQVIAQFKQNFDGSPPLSLNVENGEYKLEGGAGHPDGPDPFVTPLAPATTGAWTDWVLHVRFSADPAVGSVDVWKDGQQVVANFMPKSGTLYPGPGGEDASYVKLGYYREASIAQPGTVYFDGWRIGTTMDAVSAP